MPNKLRLGNPIRFYLLLTVLLTVVSVSFGCKVYKLKSNRDTVRYTTKLDATVEKKLKDCALKCDLTTGCVAVLASQPFTNGSYSCELLVLDTTTGKI